MKGYVGYGFGTPQQELDGALLWLRVSEEARAAVLELLPDLYTEAGLVPPQGVTEGDVYDILDHAPAREDLLARLLIGDTFFSDLRQRYLLTVQWNPVQKEYYSTTTNA